MKHESPPARSHEECKSHLKAHEHARYIGQSTTTYENIQTSPSEPKNQPAPPANTCNEQSVPKGHIGPRAAKQTQAHPVQTSKYREPRAQLRRVVKAYIPLCTHEAGWCLAKRLCPHETKYAPCVLSTLPEVTCPPAQPAPDPDARPSKASHAQCDKDVPDFPPAQKTTQQPRKS